MNPDTRFQDYSDFPENSSRTITGEGYLTAPAVLATAGVFTYLASELGLTDRKGTDTVHVFRSINELQKAVESFESQTITLDHKWTDASNWRANAIGDVRDVEIRGDSMMGTLIVRDAEAIRAIGKGKAQLSNGYSARLVPKKGKFRGQAYDFEQTDFHGNHTAVVDAARCGPVCRVADSEPPKENTMITRSFDGLSVSLENEQSGQVFDRVVRELGEAKTQITTLKAVVPKVKIGDKELDATEVTTLITAKDTEITALKGAAQTPEQIHALVVARSNAITSAHEMVPDLKVGDSDDAHKIRLAALTAVITKDETAKAMLDAALGSTKLEAALPAVVEVAFATISAGLKRARDARKTTDSRRQVGSLATATATDEKDPRQAWMQSQSDAWKGDTKSKTEVN